MLHLLVSSLPELLHIGNALVQDALLAPLPLDLELEQPDVLHALAVVEVTLTEDGLLDPDLLIQQRSLVVAPQQLFGQVVPLSYHLNEGQ